MGLDDGNKLDICMKTEILQLATLKDVLSDDSNSRVSEDLVLATHLQQRTSERLQDCSELYITGKGLCVQSAFRARCTVSTISLALRLSPSCRLAVLVQCKAIPESLWHSTE